jgi:hypothetical protein
MSDREEMMSDRGDDVRQRGNPVRLGMTSEEEG